jgi:membrane protein YqaA with SNARE-associated domain
MPVVGQPIIDFYGAHAQWQKVVETYRGPWGTVFLAAAAFTPIPYKVATIAAGATGMPMTTFVVVSTIGRAGRFFLVAGLLRVFGAPIRAFIEKHFDAMAIAFTVLLVGGFLVLRWL